MKTKRIFNLIGLVLIVLSPAAIAAGHGGGGGAGFGSTFSGGGHFGGGGGRAGGFGPGRAGTNGRPSYFYSRGMHFAGSGGGQMPSRIRQSAAPTTSNQTIANSGRHTANRTN